MKTTSLVLLSTAALLGLTACTSPLPKRDTALTGPFYTPANVHGAAQIPATVRRIALLPAASTDPRVTEESLRDLDRVLAASLTAAARAEITPVSRETLTRLTQRTHFVSTAVLPNNFMKTLATETGADAFMFVDVTTASSYPPLALGLRARLVDAKESGPIWNFDNVFSAADPTIVNSARAHVLNRTTSSNTPANFSYTVLQNPTAFSDYAATAMWATLPPR